MKVTTTALPGVLVLEPMVFRDERGLFFESFNQRAFDEAIGRHVEFVQDNHSCSRRGVLRGLHYQLPPHAQGKLVRVARGSAFDVVVDIRRDSPTFRRWRGMTLDAESQRQLWIPAGFAHGFMALQDDTVLLYKTTDFHAKDHERSISWNDPDVAIDWPDVGAAPLLAAKDAAAPALAQAELF
jgi:dTDP-4-dehydrorhamnose 3,5-epimerase